MVDQTIFVAHSDKNSFFCKRKIWTISISKMILDV